MTVTEARAALPAIVDRVLAGEEVTLTRHGVPVAMVVRPDALRVRRADQALAVAASVHDLLETGRQSGLNTEPMLSRKRAGVLVAGVGASRSNR